MIENTKKKESWMIDYKAVVGSICTGATGARSYIFTSPGIEIEISLLTKSGPQEGIYK